MTVAKETLTQYLPEDTILELTAQFVEINDLLICARIVMGTVVDLLHSERTYAYN